MTNDKQLLEAAARAAGWQPIDTCPRHTRVLFYRKDAGVFYGEYTYCAEWISEAEQEREQYDDETLWSEDCWSFDVRGAYRCEGDETPTHWMALPPEPAACDPHQKGDGNG